MDELPAILTEAIADRTDGFLRLAQAVFVQAWQDAQGCDLTRRTEARRWLRKEGLTWLEWMGCGNLYPFLMDKLGKHPRKEMR